MRGPIGRWASSLLIALFLCAPSYAMDDAHAQLCAIFAASEAGGETGPLTVKVLRQKLPGAAKNADTRNRLRELVPYWLDQRPADDLPSADDVATLLEGMISGYWSLDEAIETARLLGIGRDERARQALIAALWAWYQNFGTGETGTMMSAADLMRIGVELFAEPHGFRSVTRDLDAWKALFLGNDNRRHYGILDHLKSIKGHNVFIGSDLVRLDVAAQTLAAAAAQNWRLMDTRLAAWKARVGDMAATYRMTEKDIRAYLIECARSAVIRKAVDALERYYRDLFRGQIALGEAFSHNHYVLILAHSLYVTPNEGYALAARRALREAIAARDLPSLDKLEAHLATKLREAGPREKLGQFLGETYPPQRQRDLVFVMPGQDEVEISGEGGDIRIKYKGRALFGAPDLLIKAWKVHEANERNAALFSFSPQLHRAAALLALGDRDGAAAEIGEVSDYAISGEYYGDGDRTHGILMDIVETLIKDKDFKEALLLLLKEAGNATALPSMPLPGPQGEDGMAFWSEIGQLREPENAERGAAALKERLSTQGPKTDAWSVAISRLDDTDSIWQAFHLLRVLKTRPFPLSLSRRNSFVSQAERRIAKPDAASLSRCLDEKNDEKNQILAMQVTCIWMAGEMKPEAAVPILVKGINHPELHVISESIKMGVRSKEMAEAFLPGAVKRLADIHHEWTTAAPQNGSRAAFLERVQYAIDGVHIVAEQQPDLKEAVRTAGKDALLAVMRDTSLGLELTLRAYKTLSFIYERKEPTFRMDGETIVPIPPFE